LRNTAINYNYFLNKMTLFIKFICNTVQTCYVVVFNITVVSLWIRPQFWDVSLTPSQPVYQWMSHLRSRPCYKHYDTEPTAHAQLHGPEDRWLLVTRQQSLTWFWAKHVVPQGDFSLWPDVCAIRQKEPFHGTSYQHRQVRSLYTRNS
jgi:hypothetical protein